MEKVKLKDVANVYYIGNVSNSIKQRKSAKWVVANSLNEEVGTFDIIVDDSYDIDKSIPIDIGDIIIKRVNPKNIIYNDQTEDDIYAYSNLIVIKINDNVSKKYIACVLEKEIKKIIKLVGNKIPSIERKELELIEIKIMPNNEDIGEIWYLNKKNRHLKYKKIVLEEKKNEFIINSCLLGGNEK